MMLFRPLIAGGLMLTAVFGLTAQAEQYTLMIFETPAELASRSDNAKGAAYWSAYADYSKAMQAAGVLRGGAALAVDDRARRVEIRNGKRRVTDTRAALGLGGYFIIDVATLDAALDWAAKAPTQAGVEVHPTYPAPTMQ